MPLCSVVVAVMCGGDCGDVAVAVILVVVVAISMFFYYLVIYLQFIKLKKKSV